jgi:dephospho-CoA kinase
VTAVRIGLTGPIGCGKSTIGAWLGEAGARVIDADEVAREVSAPGGPIHDEIVAAFGASVASSDGTLDRAALGRLVFADPNALTRLEGIVHPAVRVRIVAAIEAADRERAPAIVIEAIKLVEGGLAAVCDEVWLVRCDSVTQRQRLRSRADEPAEDVERRIAAQAGLADRVLPAASRVLDTSGQVEPTRELVLRAYAAALAGAPPA